MEDIELGSIKNNDERDIKETNRRNAQYTALMELYVNNQKRMHISRLVFKCIFFALICFSFLGIIYVGTCVLLTIAKKDSTGIPDIGIAMTGLGSILSVIITLPTIIAEHLFPKEGDKAENSLVAQMQKFDLTSKYNGHIYVELEDENDEADTNDSQ